MTVKMICMIKRKPGMSVEEFHRYWREVHGPLVASTRSGRHASRYEQNHRPLADYRDDDDRRGWDGVKDKARRSELLPESRRRLALWGGLAGHHESAAAIREHPPNASAA